MILDGGLLQRSLLRVTGAHHHVSAALDGSLHGVAVIVRWPRLPLAGW